MIKKLIIIWFINVALAGCASMTSDPYLKDILTYPERIEFENEDEQKRVSYIARYLMEEDDRQKLEAEFSQTTYNKGLDETDLAVGSMMITDASVGVLGSSSGHTVGVAVFAAGAVLGEIFDGAMDMVGGVYLPKELNGNTLNTQEEAQNALYDLIGEKMVRIAKSKGMEVKCISDCRGNNATYHFKNKGNPNPGYIYWPDDILLKINMQPLSRVIPNSVRDAALGFPVVWSTGGVSSFLVWGGAEPYFDENGEVILKKRDGRAYYEPSLRRGIAKTRIGRDMLNSFYDDNYFIFSDSDIYPYVVYFGGEKYSYIGDSSTNFVKYKLEEDAFIVKPELSEKSVD